MKIRLGDIKPNHFRNIERYPIDRDKIEALKASINRTSFWNNVVARQVEGGAELGYGHHRLVALNELYDPDHEVDLIMLDLDDEAMLHVMADENMQEWEHKGPVIIETVRAVHDFLGREPGKASTGGRPESNDGAEEVSTFLGWPYDRVRRALSIILAEEAGALEPEDTAGLDLRQADELRKATSKIKKRKTKKKAIKAVRDKLEEGEIGYRGILNAVNEVQEAEADEGRRRPAVPAAVAQRLYSEIEGYWRKTTRVNGRPIARSELLRLIAEMRNSEELTRSVRPWADQLADALDGMATEAERLAELLRAEQTLAIGAVN